MLLVPTREGRRLPGPAEPAAPIENDIAYDADVQVLLGVAVNQLINVAVAEKVSALRTEEYFAERVARGDVKKALRILTRAGKGSPPFPGDELPADRRRPPTRRRVR